MQFPLAIPLHPSSWFGPSQSYKNGERILAFLYGMTFQQCPSIKGMGLVSEPKDLSPTAWAGWWWFFFFFNFRQRGSVWNGAFSLSHPRNYSVFQGPEPVTTSQPLPNHLCHVSSDREVGELWVQEDQRDRVPDAEKPSTGSQFSKAKSTHPLVLLHPCRAVMSELLRPHTHLGSSKFKAPRPLEAGLWPISPSTLTQGCTHPGGASFSNLSANRETLGRMPFINFLQWRIPYSNYST